MDSNNTLGQEGKFPQYQNQDEQYQAQLQYQQKQQQQHEAQQQQIQNQIQQQQILHQQQQTIDNQQQQRQRESINLEAVIAMMAENQTKLVEGMNRLLTKLDDRTPQPSTDSRHARQQAPHLPSTSYPSRQRQP